MTRRFFKLGNAVKIAIASPVGFEGLRKVAMIACLAGITMFLGCGQVKHKNIQNLSSTDWETLEKHDYAIQYPDSFDLNTSGQMGTSFILYLNKGSFNEVFRENINLLIQDLRGYNVSLDDYVEISENQIKTLITDGKLIESKRFTKGKSEFHELTYTGTQGAFILKWKQQFIIKNEKAYILTLTTRIEQFDDYKTVGEKIMNSFIIK